MDADDIHPDPENTDAGGDDELDGIVADYVARVARGERPPRAEWLARHPEHASELAAFFDDYDRFGQVSQPLPADVLDPYSLVGTSLGDYEIEEQVGRGGMGAVFRARQVSLGRRVALKLVLGGRLASAEERERFQREALAAARLDHPRIVQVYEVGEVEGRPYYTMPFFEGGSLAARMTEYAEHPRLAAMLVSRAARAVHCANEAGILHRDVKPSNILLDAHGEPCLADFGLAKEAGTKSDLTRTGAVLGTAEYIAPELTRGSKAQATRAADIYSLGAVLFEMLAGGPPFRGATALDTLDLARRSDPPSLRKRNPRVAKDLETICQKCLEKDPRRRYATARDFADDLDRHLRGEPILARPTPRWERVLKWALRHPTLSVGCLLVATGLSVVALLALRHNAELRSALEHSRRHFHLSTMRLAYEAAGDGRLGELETMLEAARPAPGEEDLRSFDWHVLRRFAGARRWSLVHPEPIGRVVFHPARLILACAGKQGTVYVWDLEGEKLVARIEASTYPVEALAFSADGSLLAAAGMSQPAARQPLPVSLWSWERGEKVLEISDAPSRIIGLWFDAAGESLIVCGAERMEVRSLPGGSPRAAVPGKTSFTLFAGSRGAPELVLLHASGGSKLLLHGVKNGEPTQPLPLPSVDCRSVAFAEDGKWLAQGSTRGQAFLISREDRSVTPLQGLRDTVGALSFSRDGRLLAAGSRATRRGGQLSVYEVPSGRLRSRVQAHSGSLASVAFSPAGDHMATCASDSEARVWSLDALDLAGRRDLQGNGRAMALSQDGSSLAVANARSGITFLHASSATVSSVWPKIAGIEVLAFSPDANLLAGGSGRRVRLWSVRDSTMLAELPAHQGGVRRLRFDPGGGLLAAGSYAQIKVWNVASGREAAVFSPHSYRILGLVFSSDGRRLLSSGVDGRLVSTTVGSWESRLVARVPAPVMDLALAPDDALAALAREDGRVSLVDIGDGRITGELEGHEGTVHCVAFSRDGKLIATGAADRTLRLWDRALARERAIIKTDDILQQMEFGAGDELLAAVSFGPSLSLLQAAPDRVEPRLLTAVPHAGPRVGGGAGNSSPDRWRRVEHAFPREAGSTLGAAWGDYDGDGDPDVCTLRYGPHQLLRNEGSGRFEDVAGDALGSERRGVCAAWGDIEGDGDLDLVLGYENAPGRLFRNGGGELREASSDVLGRIGFAAWGDLDGDSDLDLLTMGGTGSNLLRNDGAALADATPQVIGKLRSSDTATLLDIDGDGDLDICAGSGSAGPSFYTNEGSFRFRRGSRPFSWESRSYDALSWSDWDGDGDMDCAVAVRAKTDRPSDTTVDELILYLNHAGRFREAGGRLVQAESMIKGLAWGDFDLDGGADLFVARDDGKSMLLRHDGDALEVDEARGLPETLGNSVTSATWVDHDGDGDLDLSFTDFDGPNTLYENRQEKGLRLQVRLEGASPNRPAIGTRVRLWAGGRAQTRMVGALEAGRSGHSLPLHFGLGDAQTVDRLVVRWPKGHTQVLEDLPADRMRSIEEETSSPPERVLPVVPLLAPAELDGAAALSPAATASARVRWRKLDGPPGDALDDPGALVTSVRFASAGRYLYELVSEADDDRDEPLLRLTVPVAPVGIEVHGTRDPIIDLLEVPVAGDAAFDPADPDVLHVTSDTLEEKGGSIRRFRLGAAGPRLEDVVDAAYPGAVLAGPGGEVWFAREPPAGPGVALLRLGPAGAAPRVPEVVLAAFPGFEKARPTALALVPPGFASPRTSPGDILIALSRRDEDVAPIIGKFTPLGPGKDPAAGIGIVEAPGIGAEWKGWRLGAIAFAPDGSSVYLLPHGKPFLLELDPAFELRRKVAPVGAEFRKLDTLAMDPRDGRLWVGDDLREEVWSLDPVTFEARLEASFVRDGAREGSARAIDFHPPSMRFSGDGKRLVMSDVNGWVWVLRWE